jgi:hypothetical protein
VTVVVVVVPVGLVEVVVEVVGTEVVAVPPAVGVVVGTVELDRVTPVDDRRPSEGAGDEPPPASTDPRSAASTITTAADAIAIARRRLLSWSGVRLAA